ncbi:MAG TPA: hypothetical protein PKA03_00290 [Tabrizicola sp.]|nr:hypothetical protein [Tabrizicola sp.]
MKIIVHMGQNKTGTTSLQHSLHFSTELLESRSVYYPRFRTWSPNHHLLIAHFGSPEKLSHRTVEQMGGLGETRKAAWDAWEETVETVHRKRPELLILSSEFILPPLDATEKSRFARELFKLSSDILPVAYIRHPVHHFRARLQQSLKNRTGVPKLAASGLQRSILDVERAFGKRPELIAFDRSVLHGGDIVQDFATRFLSRWIKPSDLPRVHANQGLSAEALVLMIELRAGGGGTDEAADNVSRLVRLLTSLDQSDPPAESLTLLPEVAEAILRASSSYRWLADTGQLQIPGLDTDRIDGTSLPDWIKTASPGSLFRHDHARLERLRKAVEASRARQIVKKDTQPYMPPRTDQAPRPRRSSKHSFSDFLLRFVRRKLASLQDRKTGAAPTRGKAHGRSSQGDRNEDHETSGNLDTCAHDRP